MINWEMCDFCFRRATIPLRARRRSLWRAWFDMPARSCKVCPQHVARGRRYLGSGK